MVRSVVQIVFKIQTDVDVVMQIRSHSIYDTFKASITMHFSLSA